jgi:hypothetical protein
MDRIENDASNKSPIVACVFVEAGEFTELSPSNNTMGNTYRYTDTKGK